MDTNYAKMNMHEFVEMLASKQPTPGGGGASALCGALGVALGNMVISLTLGKRKYAHAEEELKVIQATFNQLQEELIRLVDEDAASFTPLANAYALPATTEEEIAYKNKVMAKVLVDACMIPLAIMQCCLDALVLLETVAEKGSVMAVSDAGAGAKFCLCALESASLNVYINTKTVANKNEALRLEKKTDEMIERGREIEQRILNFVGLVLRPH